jgi:hypothetical protein
MAELTPIIALGQIIIILLLGVALKLIVSISARIASIETWKDMHERQDNEAHLRATVNIDRLWQKIETR